MKPKKDSTGRWIAEGKAKSVLLNSNLFDDVDCRDEPMELVLKEEEKPEAGKPFSLEEAKAGKPVCTRDGRDARIICFDKKGDYHPIVALVDYGNSELVCSYDTAGRIKADGQYDDDLMMATENKSGWINMYKETEGEYYMDKAVFRTRESALKAVPLRDRNYIATIKMNWEE